MKKKLLLVNIILALAVSGYTAYAWGSTRGLRVSLMGQWLASTWQLTLLAAAVLWLPTVIVLLRGLSRLRTKKLAGDTQAFQPEPARTNVVSDAYGAPVAGEGEPFQPTKVAELIPPAAPAEGTAPLSSDVSAWTAEPIPPAEPAEGTAPLSSDAPADGTVLLPPDASAEGTVPLSPDAEQIPQVKKARFCAKCGKPITGRFCARCGAKVES